jgi:hypothetical protein
VSVGQPIVVGSPAQFGFERYEFSPENEAGGIETQAAAHPFQLTTTLALNQTTQPTSECSPYKIYDEAPEPERFHLNPCVASPSLPKDLNFDLPVGLVGNAAAAPKCTEEQFDTRDGPGCALQHVRTHIGPGSLLSVGGEPTGEGQG